MESQVSHDIAGFQWMLGTLHGALKIPLQASLHVKEDWQAFDVLPFYLAYICTLCTKFSIGHKNINLIYDHFSEFKKKKKHNTY